MANNSDCPGEGAASGDPSLSSSSYKEFPLNGKANRSAMRQDTNWKFQLKIIIIATVFLCTFHSKLKRNRLRQKLAILFKTQMEILIEHHYN